MRLALIIILSCLAACSNLSEERAPSKTVSVSVNPGDIEFKAARYIAYQYLSHVAWYDYDGGPVNVTSCNGSEPQECKYFVHHSGNKCSFSSYVSENCLGNLCHLEFSQYDQISICE